MLAGYLSAVALLLLFGTWYRARIQRRFRASQARWDAELRLRCVRNSLEGLVITRGLVGRDLWLAVQVFKTAGYFASEQGLRATLRDLHDWHASESRDADIYLRKLKRAAKDTRHQELHRAFMAVPVIVARLATENSLCLSFGRLRARLHQGHLEEKRAGALLALKHPRVERTLPSPAFA